MITSHLLNSEKHRLINLLSAYGIKDPVLSAFDEIPRELFVEKKYQSFAYEDRALPTLQGQTISQPSLVALTLQVLGLQPADIVLEIGTGSGFQTALLAKLVKKVYSIERFAELAGNAEKRINNLGITNVKIISADGTMGYAKHAPYDSVIVTAAFHKVPEPLIDQLKTGGKLIMPIGQDVQELVLFEKQGKELQAIKTISDVLFVPLVGKHAN